MVGHGLVELAEDVLALPIGPHVCRQGAQMSSAARTCRGTHKAEFAGIPAIGNQATISAINIHRVVDGVIREGWLKWDALGFMQQLGFVGALPDSLVLAFDVLSFVWYDWDIVCPLGLRVIDVPLKRMPPLESGPLSRPRNDQKK